MTDWREELIEKMAREIGRYSNDTPWTVFAPEARAALAVAEPVIREQCARIAEKSFGFHGHYAIYIAAAIRDSRNCVPEGGKDENQTKLY